MLNYISESLGDLFTKDPALSHRFGVFFFRGGRIPLVTDFMFQRVGGLSSEVQVDAINEGGQNLFPHRLPGRISYGNLALERGFALLSPLTWEFINTFTRHQFIPSSVLVVLLGDAGMPLASWVFEKAYPVKWSFSDLEAQDSKVFVDSMELAYTRYQTITI